MEVMLLVMLLVILLVTPSYALVRTVPTTERCRMCQIIRFGNIEYRHDAAAF